MSYDTFQQLDEKINNVATKVIHLGDQLDSVNVHRARLVEAHRLMAHLDEFLASGPLTSPLFTDPLRVSFIIYPSDFCCSIICENFIYNLQIDEAADIIQKLYLISQDLPSPKYVFKKFSLLLYTIFTILLSVLIILDLMVL